MKKKAITIGVMVLLVLSFTASAYAAVYSYTMTYMPGTTDPVTELPDPDAAMGAEEYTTSSKNPQRKGFEFLYWILDYGLAYKVDYVVNPDPLYGVPDDSIVPTDTTRYKPGSPVTVADQLSSTQDFGIDGETGVTKGGIWTFEEWDKTDFSIYEDTTITGGWKFSPMFKVDYVVNPDPVYGIPEDAMDPPDPARYAPGALVSVAKGLTTFDGFGINNETGECEVGVWTFVMWDTEDFEISADTTITGGWTFTPTKYTVEYVVNPDPVYGVPDNSIVPNDPTQYVPGDGVTVADQLSSTQETGINSKTGEKRLGRWEFIPWDKADFQIYENTTITGEWKFISKYKYTVHHLDIDTYQQLADDEVVWIDELGLVAPQSKTPKTEFFTAYRNSKYTAVTEKVYLNKRKDFLLPGSTYSKNKTRYVITVTLTEDDQHIFFFYQRPSAG